MCCQVQLLMFLGRVLSTKNHFCFFRNTKLLVFYTRSKIQLVSKRPTSRDRSKSAPRSNLKPSFLNMQRTVLLKLSISQCQQVSYEIRRRLENHLAQPKTSKKRKKMRKSIFFHKMSPIHRIVPKNPRSPLC